MLGWFYRGLTSRGVTTRYPVSPESMPEGFRGRPVVHPERLDPGASWEPYEQACLPRAIQVTGEELTLDLGHCICCGLCAQVPGGAFTMEPDFELAVRDRQNLVTVVRRGG